ncbi:helix-turn-helix domain-containing protein [Bacillus marinisedimentorum]|uniref:helix-turn-helix domain-containing protein n=1 Tax=Bacillus marinisedimentorum TaxID=1821260 RepID=UPI0008728F0D|nr:helix-turn-helix transcriptional regulator [Bacillus marinisedimentorum]
MSVGANIRLNRENCKMSVEELALKTRLGCRTIEKYESGEQLPDLQTILKISTVLDVPASELLEKEEPQENADIDPEIVQLVKSLGTKRAKLLLRKATEFSEEDLLHVMQMLYEIKYTNHKA